MAESRLRRTLMNPFRFNMTPGISSATGHVDRWIDKAKDKANEAKDAYHSFGKLPDPPPPERPDRESIKEKKERWGDQSWRKLNE
jgi:hypothetical protein